MSERIRAVLFDLDGVLVETRKLHYDALARALADLGFELPFSEHQQLYDGLPTYKKIELLSTRFSLTPDQVKFLNDKKQQYTVQLLNGKIKPSPEHQKILGFLRANNIKTAVCSNTKRFTLNFILEQLEIKEFFDFSLSNEDISEPKPSPEIYLHAMERLKVLPHETLVFEDSPHGLEAARKAKAIVEQVDESGELTLDRVRRLVS
jgi:beta-phosphoglucomutase